MTGCSVPEFKSFSEAVADGSVRYYTGKPCLNGHIAERHVKNRTCTECGKDRSREDYHADPEAWKLNNLAYREANPERVRGYARTQEAIRKNRCPAWADRKAILEVYRLCPVGMHVDHVIPLQGELVSGLHVHNNLQYLTPLQNLEKGNRFNPAEFTDA